MAVFGHIFVIGLLFSGVVFSAPNKRLEMPGIAGAVGKE